MRTFAVIGIGPTIRHFKHDDPYMKIIGVNDFLSKLEKHGNSPQSKPSLLLLDPPKKFTDERLANINKYSYHEVITSEPLWKSFFYRSQHIKTIHAIPPVNGKALIELLDKDKTEIPCSFDSTFAACIEAYHQGANSIIIYGADFNDHKTLSKPEILDNILKNYSLLQVNLKLRGVNLRVYSAESRLSMVLDAVC